MALSVIVKDGSETGLTAANKINAIVAEVESLDDQADALNPVGSAGAIVVKKSSGNYIRDAGLSGVDLSNMFPVVLFNSANGKFTFSQANSEITASVDGSIFIKMVVDYDYSLNQTVLRLLKNGTALNLKYDFDTVERVIVVAWGVDVVAGDKIKFQLAVESGSVGRITAKEAKLLVEFQ